MPTMAPTADPRERRVWRQYRRRQRLCHRRWGRIWRGQPVDSRLVIANLNYTTSVGPVAADRSTVVSQTAFKDLVIFAKSVSGTRRFGRLAVCIAPRSHRFGVDVQAHSSRPRNAPCPSPFSDRGDASPLTEAATMSVSPRRARKPDAKERCCGTESEKRTSRELYKLYEGV